MSGAASLHPAVAVGVEARQVHDAALVVDLHCDLLLASYFLRWDWGRRHRENPLPGAPLLGHCDIPRLRAGNIGAMALGIVVNPLRRASAPAAVGSDFDRMERELARFPADLALARTSQGIQAARRQGRIAVFAGLEGAHGLNGSIEHLPAWKARGLGYVGLAHFTANKACRPMTGWGSSASLGLTDHGRELVDACNDLGITVDVAHVNKPGLLEVCARSRAPVICSHSACTAVHRSPRGIDDAQIQAVARTGGVVGIIFVTPFIGRGGVEAVCDHLEHIRRLVGIEHCALGSDWEGFALYPRDLCSADRLPVLTEALLRRGWSADDIHRFYGGNALRVLAGVEAAGRR